MRKEFTLIGLTGATGSGKSTVSGFFEENGYVVINADKIARNMFQPESVLLKMACGVFGNGILNSDGTLNRQQLAGRAFSSPENTQALNDITHPYIFLQVLKKCRENIEIGHNKIVFDAPLLFESNSDIMCDFVVSVTAPYEIRLERLKKRDGLSTEQIKQRMSAQHEDNYYIERSDFVIDGSQSLEAIREKVKILTDRFS